MAANPKFHDDCRKEAVLVAQPNGWYCGYKKENLRYVESIREDNMDHLFTWIKHQTDENVHLMCYEGNEAFNFYASKNELEKQLDGRKETIIWRYRTPAYKDGKKQAPIGTKINLAEYEISALPKGLLGVIIRDDKAAGVYELVTGGLIGSNRRLVDEMVLRNICIDELREYLTDMLKCMQDVKLITPAEFGLIK